MRLKITGRIERMNQEPQDAAASSQEVLGYENHGKEAKRRDNGDDGRENGCGGIHTRKWEKLVATRGTLKGNKEERNNEGERTEWHDVDWQSSTRHQNRPESLSSCLDCLCAPHRDDSIANSLLFSPFFSIFVENLLSKMRAFNSPAIDRWVFILVKITCDFRHHYFFRWVYITHASISCKAEYKSII